MLRILKKGVPRTSSSLLQFADSPLRALADGGVEIWGLLKIAEPLGRIGIVPFREQIDQRDLDEGRLLLLEGVHHALANLRLAGVTAESVERGQTHIDAAVKAQGAQQ